MRLRVETGPYRGEIFDYQLTQSAVIGGIMLGTLVGTSIIYSH